MDEFGAAHQILSINSGSQTSLKFKEVTLECKEMNFKKVKMDDFGAAHQILSINSSSQTS